MQSPGENEKILTIDIGGSRIKGTLLDVNGNMLMDYQRISTPKFAGPENVMQGIVQLTKNFNGFTRVAVGFPGYVRCGVVHTAPNLGTNKWRQIALSDQLSAMLHKPDFARTNCVPRGAGRCSITRLTPTTGRDS